jgi:hypothetical protein
MATQTQQAAYSFPHGECGSPAGGVNLTRKRLNEARQQAIGSTACGSFNS